MRFYFTIFIILLFSHYIYGQVSISQEPPWIIKEKYDPNAVAPENGVDGGVQILLYTEQVNIDLEESYIKGASKVVEYSGIQNISTIAADYDPSFQQLRFHNIEVTRNGTRMNKLTYQDIQTARREINADNFIYDGTITAFVNIPDVRMGDIVTYSYSIKGFNPIHEKFSTSFVLNSFQAIDKLSVHVFGKKKINYQVLNSDLEVNYRLNHGVHHYEWSHQNVPAVLPEEQSPSWYLQNAMVVLSEYDSWAEVIAWGKEIFTFTEPLNAELQSVIDDIKNTYPKEGARIKAALSFVQNEVRYLGLHSGIGAYKPHSPNKIIIQRFGDCKDKSILFTTMLKAMDIEAYPTLVNTSLRQLLPSMTPSSKLFDHCITKVIDSNGTILWYDPTLSDQGGSYDKIFIPDYRYGLVLDQNLAGLDTISNFGNNMVEVFSKFKLDEMGKGAELEVRSHYFEGEADFMRGVFRNNNKELIEKELMKFYAQTYGAISPIAPPVFVDDSINNEFAVLERYQIDSVWRPSVEKPNHLNLSIFPTNLTNALTMPSQGDRSAPFALAFPMVRKQNIEIVLPERIQAWPESKTINSDFFYYDFNSEYDTRSNILTLAYYYKNQDDHVPAASYRDFHQEMVRLDQQLGYLISINKNMRASTGNFGFGLGILFGYGIIVLIFIAILVIVFILLLRKRSV